MAIALPLLVTLFAPLHGAVQWLSGGSAATNTPQAAANDAQAGAGHGALPGTTGPALRVQSQARPVAGSCGGTGNGATRAWHGPTRAAQAQRPLRVVRVVEPRTGQASAGRMVISGRMEDVCAELDRLAALEAA